MSEKSVCPKCRAGYLFPEEHGTVVKCLICGYSESKATSGKKSAANVGGLGQYMATYPSIPEVKVVKITSGGNGQKPKRTCAHNQDVVTVGNFELWLSELPSRSWIREKPDLGVYLAEPWLSVMGNILTNGVSLKSGAPYDVIYIDWPDRGIVSVQCLIVVVNKVIEYLESGKQVEIGCWGGHGRTGTTAACLLSAIEHVSGEKAIEEIHSRYCKRAVEGVVQEQLVKDFHREFTI